MNVTSNLKAVGIAAAFFVFGAVVAWQYSAVQRLPDTPAGPPPPQLAAPTEEVLVPEPAAQLPELAPATVGTAPVMEHTVISLLDLPGDFEQSRALYELLGKADVERIKQHIADAELIRSPSDRRAALQVAYLKFSELDAQAALDHLIHSTNPAKESLLYVMFRNWEKFNPEFAMRQITMLDPHSQKIASNGMMDAHDVDDVDSLRRLITRMPAGATSERHLVSNIVENAMDNPPEAVRQALRLRSSQQRSSALAGIAQQWAVVDSRAAAAHRTNLPGSDNKRSYDLGLFRQMASQDPEGLFKTLTQYSSKETQATIVRFSLNELTQRNPAKALDLASKMEQSQMRTQAIIQVIMDWIQRDPAAGASALDNLGMPSIKRSLGHQVAREYARRDPVAALRWAEQSEGRKGNLWLLVITSVAEVQPVDALALLDSVEPSPERLDAMNNLLGIVAQSDPQLAISHFENLPDGHTKVNVARSIAVTIARQQPDLAMEWALSLPVAMQVTVLSNLASAVMGHGVAGALAYLDVLPTEEIKTQWMDQIVNHSAQLDAREAASWLADYADHPKYGRWMSNVANYIAQEDPIEALALIGELEGGEHYQSALQNVVSAWANKDGKAAANYVGKLRQAEYRPQLVRQVTSAWFRYDPRGAERWVMGLNHSEERDSGLIAMLENVQYLEDAQRRRMLDRLSSEQGRSQVVFNFVQQLMQYDPDEARIWLNSSYLRDDQRLQLEQQLARTQERHQASTWVVQ